MCLGGKQVSEQTGTVISKRNVYLVLFQLFLKTVLAANAYSEDIF